MKMVKLDEKIGDKEKNEFLNFFAKVAFLNFFFAI
jgi:hypothetical protein